MQRDRPRGHEVARRHREAVGGQPLRDRRAEAAAGARTIATRLCAVAGLVSCMAARRPYSASAGRWWAWRARLLVSVERG